jgi:hypothetical protein
MTSEMRTDTTSQMRIFLLVVASQISCPLPLHWTASMPIVSLDVHTDFSHSRVHFSNGTQSGWNALGSNDGPAGGCFVI